MTAPMHYKTSCFVHEDCGRVVNDLTNRSYSLHSNEVQWLKQLARSAPEPLEEKRNPQSRLEYLVQEKLLIPLETDESGSFYPHRVDIETCRQCNARCRYCPQSVSRKSAGVMTLELFEFILERLRNTPPNWIAFNHYGEPLLDPWFRERVRLLWARGLSLRLYTNATLLTESLIELLREGPVHGVVFNFPALEFAEWQRLMQLSEKAYWQARRGIEQFLTRCSDIPVTLAINGVTADQVQRTEQVTKHFTAFGKHRIRAVLSSSRLGHIENEQVTNTPNLTSEYFAGCDRFAGHLHVSWEGKVFLCCQDYDQQCLLGDLRSSSVSEIMNSATARQLRAEMFGLAPLQTDRLCRKCPMLRHKQFEDDAVSLS